MEARLHLRSARFTLCIGSLLDRLVASAYAPAGIGHGIPVLDAAAVLCMALSNCNFRRVLPRCVLSKTQLASWRLGPVCRLSTKR